MKNSLIRWLAVLVLGGAYWLTVSMVTGKAEPWDARGYWTLWYPGSLVVAAVAGVLAPDRAWLAGLLVTMTQWPVMATTADMSGNLWLVGLLFTGLLALPTIAVSALAGRLARR